MITIAATSLRRPICRLGVKSFSTVPKEPKITFANAPSTTTASKAKTVTKEVNAKRGFKEELVQDLAETHDISQAKAQRIISHVLDTIVKTVSDGKPARLSGFGTFEQYTSKATTRKNPQTGTPLDIPATNRVRFRPHGTFKDVVKESKP
eukprot:Nitzschia sp. Nitz4//scaffold31_size150131//130214//130751//NITZ4_002851-RA/size150131-snap-gene-0.95-mRNA-1//-1//CDS//3329547728//896//frame0